MNSQPPSTMSVALRFGLIMGLFSVAYTVIIIAVGGNPLESDWKGWSYMTDQIGDGLLIEPAPGHAPGHVILRLLSGGQEGVFIGDVMHHPIQVYRPEWSSRFCTGSPIRSATRSFLERYSSMKRSTLIGGVPGFDISTRSEYISIITDAPATRKS